MPGTVLGSGPSAVNKIDKIFELMKMTFYQGRQTIKWIKIDDEYKGDNQSRKWSRRELLSFWLQWPGEPLLYHVDIWGGGHVPHATWTSVEQNTCHMDIWGADHRPRGHLGSRPHVTWTSEGAGLMSRGHLGRRPQATCTSVEEPTR